MFIVVAIIIITIKNHKTYKAKENKNQLGEVHSHE
jgi:hypothetical protein